MILIVAGVAGSGKTTVGALIAGRLHWRFADADAFHPEANLAKMRSGVPLTDEDRQPWLHAVAEWMDARIASGESGVVTCSALRRSYREMLLSGRPEATMVFLQVSRDVLARRLASRPGHFFPSRLLDSQLQAFQPPQPDEGVPTVLAEGETTEVAARVIAAVWPSGVPGRPGVP